ncbi:MAG: site-2 protease family protein [Acidimicrobiales bacterium]
MTDTLDPRSAPLEPQPDDAPPRPDEHADEQADEPVSRLRSLTSLLAIVALIALVSVKFGVWALVIAGGLIISIVLHEFGHYLAAKQAGMKVTEFFIGFGPKLFSFRRGETEYGIKPIPLGAYVRIVGMNNLEEVEPGDEGRTYREKGYWARLRVVLAGPFMNLAIAFVLLFALNAGFGTASPDKWSVHETVDNTAAAEAGVQPGDRVVSLAGVPITTFKQFGTVVQDNGGKQVDLVVDRDGQQVTLTPTIGWALADSIGDTLSPLQSGDKPVKVNDQPVADYQAFAAALAAAPAGTVDVQFERDGHLFHTLPGGQIATPVDLPADGARGFIGVSSLSDTVRQGPIQAVGSAGRQFGDMVTTSLGGIGRFFSPSGLSQYANLVFSTPPQGTSDTESGSSAASSSVASQIEPVEADTPMPAVSNVPSAADQNRVLSLLGVVRLGGQAGAAGINFVIFLLAMVNLFLGLINLAPLLPFDGGHAAIATYEAIRGRLSGRPYRADAAKMMPLAYAVIAVFVFVGLSSFYLDAVRPAANPFGGP